MVLAVFLKVVDIRNGDQLKDSFTLIFRIFRGKTRTMWLVGFYMKRRFYSEGNYQENNATLGKGRGQWTGRKGEQHRPGSTCHQVVQKGICLNCKKIESMNYSQDWPRDRKGKAGAVFSPSKACGDDWPSPPQVCNVEHRLAPYPHVLSYWSH